VTEAFLYFLWQFQYYDHTNLLTTEGELVQILHPGFRNANAGPDFLNARLLINDVEWVGSVEAHTKASDWLAHRHQHDPAYNNVILHIVWTDDRLPDTKYRRPTRTDGSTMPTLELQARTGSDLLSRYNALTESPDTIPCAGQFRAVQPLRITAMLDKAMLQRLERKAADVKAIYEATQDWEETAYRLLAINLGFKINADPMAQLSRAVPQRALMKHRDSVRQIEAMLFGTSGLLDAVDETETDAYVDDLRREYRFLAAKYGLLEKQVSAHVWKWGRLRPANFPTLRLAQFARLMSNHGSLFSLFVGMNDAPSLLKKLQVQPTDYWQTHYRFGKTTEKAAPTLGAASATNILINTVAPLLAAYAHHRDRSEYIDRAIALLEQLPPEKNTITGGWEELGLSIRSAFDSQASIELYNSFCTPKKCLSCQIGASLVGQK
jgi:hypothetical protein